MKRRQASADETTYPPRRLTTAASPHSVRCKYRSPVNSAPLATAEPGFFLQARQVMQIVIVCNNRSSFVKSVWVTQSELVSPGSRWFSQSPTLGRVTNWRSIMAAKSVSIASALALCLIAPSAGYAQGVLPGAKNGAEQGNDAAGPVSG